jgi:hypothetical protein
MSEFTIRSDSVDVEQIMKQIRQRILEKRGADYTEEQVRELASVRLEKFLDPKNLRSDLLEQFRKSRPPLPQPPGAPEPVAPPYVFDDQTLFASHRGPLRLIRRLLRPVLKLFFNPNVLNQILHTQAQFNLDMLKRDQRRRIEAQQQAAAFAQSRAEWNLLYYEVLHNLVLETTRMAIEVQNMRMRLDSLSSRLDFSERRVRALEGVVQYRPEVARPRESRGPEEAAGAAPGPGATHGFVPTGGEGGGRRRRRRRRGRRGGAGPIGVVGAGPVGAGGSGGAGPADGDRTAGAGSAPGDQEPLGDFDTPDTMDEPDEGSSGDDGQ